ncbi:MAG: cell wall assembly protein [Flavobacteriaceae bacterium]|jgi:hypothetical protein|nr:cell wall assembly protein [Flavobacteriaceae bacterium]
MKKEEFASMFKGYSLPKELKSLFEFQTSEGVPSYYSNAIYLLEEENFIVETFSTDETFVESFLPFAEANSSGSVYAFWIKDASEKSLENCPIVVFGDEGGVFVVAKNLKELLQIAAYDVEIVVVPFEEAFFTDREEDEDYETSEFNKEYLDWLRTEAKLKPILTIEQIDDVLNEADAAYGEALATFVNPFLEN